MHPFVIKVFRHSLDTQCNFALLAASDLDDALAGNDSDRIWLAIQSLLVAVANVSRLLFGQGGKAADRSELQAELGVDATSPIAATRLRNHFEHMDQRIETWAKSSKRMIFIDMNVGPADGGIAPGAEPIDHFRQFDPDTRRVLFWGEEYELTPVLREVERLASLLP